MYNTEEEKAKIYKDFKDKVFGYLCNKTSSYQEAEDICSDVFLKIYAKLESFDPGKASLSTWIFHITRNTLFDYFRRSRITEELDENIPEDSDFSENICREEALEALADALQIIPERERNIVLLHYYRKMSLKELSEKMGISYSYTKLLHNQAISRLKKELEKAGFFADSFV